jgi:ribosomal protein L11 methyltransferase
MPCLELTLQTTASYVEAISDFLESVHACSITWQATNEEELFESELGTMPLWQHMAVRALFAENTVIHDVINSLHSEFGKNKITHCNFKIIPDKPWERVWLDNFRPMCFGERVWVCPTGYDCPDPNGIMLRLDPGLAFGTGTHPSTALCLNWIGKHFKKNQILMEYGCGSGILAIAALKCEAQKAFAIDHDPQALEATQDNVNRNAISHEKITCLFPHQVTPDIKVDVLIANILAQPLLDLTQDFKNLLKTNGYCILSGILKNQVDTIRNYYTENGFLFTDMQYAQNWALLEAKLTS